MNFKKILSSVAIVGALATVMAASAMADATPRMWLTGPTEPVEPGEEFVIDIYGENIPEFYALQFEMEIPTGITMIENSYVNYVDISMYDINYWGQHPKFILAEDDMTSKQFTPNGHVGSLTLKAGDDLVDGDYEIEFIINYDNSYHDVQFSWDPTEEGLDYGEGPFPATGCTVKVGSEPAGPTAQVGSFQAAAEDLGGQTTFYAPMTIDPTGAADLNVKITKDETKTQTYAIPLQFDVVTTFTAIVKTRSTGSYVVSVCDGDTALATAPAYVVE